MKKSLFVVAHPDDAEVLFAHAIQASAEAHIRQLQTEYYTIVA